MTEVVSIQVKAEWDAEAAVWVASSDDVPGLVVEHADFSRLQVMVSELIPILLAENHLLPDRPGSYELPIHIAAQGLARGKALIAA
jgi:Domain of unknown function (DUF1902)